MKMLTTQEYEHLRAKADAWDVIATRAQEAHDYCQKYCFPDAWGRIVWFGVLDDAIRMRRKIEELTNTK